MQKIIKFLSSHIWIVIIVSCLIFIPQSFGYQAKLNMRVLVTGLAIDKVDDQIEVTAQVVMPNPGGEAGGSAAILDFISEKGSTLAEGIQKIAYKIGKTAGLSHTNFIMVGDSMKDENLVSYLDYLVRFPKVSSSVMVLMCEKSAKDTIKETKNLELSVGVGLQKVFFYKEESLNGIVVPVSEFINHSFGLSGSAVISEIVIKPEGEESSSQSGQQEQSGQGDSSGATNKSQSSSQDKKSRIKFYNNIYYFKKGEYVGKLDNDDEITGYIWFDTKSNNGDFEIDEVTGGVLTNAKVGLEFTKKNTKVEVDFKNGKPVMNIKVGVDNIKITEIVDSEFTNNIYLVKDEQTVNAVKEKIKQTISEKITKVFEKTRQDNVDIFDFADRSFRYHPLLWQDFYDKYQDDYLAECQINTEIDIKNIY